MRHIGRDEQGGGNLLEWASVVVLVIALSFFLSGVGQSARQRIVGDGGIDTSARVLSLEGFERRDRNAIRDLAVEGVDPTSAPSNAQSPMEPSTTLRQGMERDARRTHARCEEGFVRGAARAFVEGDGEVVGDLVGLKDAQLKEWLWDRPAGEVLAAAGRGAANAAPGLMSATPGLITSATGSAVARLREDPTGTATSVLSVLFVDSFRTVGTLAVDGWHGSSVLIASARSGDCVAFGQTLRSGVNNAPEMALSLMDVVPLTVGAVKLAPKVMRSARIASLTMATGRVGEEIIRASVRKAATGGSAARLGLEASRAVAVRGMSGGLRAARELASDTGASVGRIAQHVGSGDVRGAAREVTREVAGMGRATVAALASASAATKVGVVSVVHAVEGAGTSRFATLGESFTGRHALSAEQHAYAGLGVCVAGRCGGRSERGLCFTAGTPVETSKGNVAIETLRVGDRVATTGVRSSSQRETRVDETWRVITLELERSAGDVVRIELLRSPEWLAQTRAHAGGLIALSLPEMELEGPARVTKISDSAQIEEGSGHVVLATFESEAKDVLELRFENESEVLEPTWRHRLYSIDRREWVAAGKLRVGERLRTRTGDAVIASIRAKPGVHTVYNLEVETDHSYFVGNIGALSHNQTPYGKEEWWQYEIEEARERWPDLIPPEERVFERALHTTTAASRDVALRELAMHGGYDDFLAMYAERARELDAAFARDDPNWKELHDWLTRLDDQLMIHHGELIAEQIEHATALPRPIHGTNLSAAVVEPRDLVLWAGDLEVFDEATLVRMLTYPEGADYANTVGAAQEYVREMTRLRYAMMQETSDGVAAEAFQALRKADIEKEVYGAVVRARNRLHAPIESEKVAQALHSSAVAGFINTDNRAFARRVVRWTTSSESDLATLAGPRLANNVRARVARMAQAHEEFSHTGWSFLQTMEHYDLPLVVDANEGAELTQKWVLTLENGEPHLRPFDPNVHHAVARQSDRRSNLAPVVLENLALDEASTSAFLRFLIAYVDREIYSI